MDLGADDYLTKPFSFEVLSARLRVITRRLSTEKNSLVHVGDLTVDRETREARGETKLLTKTEYVILDRLIARARSRRVAGGAGGTGMGLGAWT